MAKYLKAAGGNWSAAATWSATGSGGADNAGAPAASDDVVLQVGSGNCTIDAASVCRSIDASAYGAGKTLTHNAFTLTIGDGTAGAGNKALDFSGGFTYTLANATTSAISFQSSSATQQTINFAGKTSGNVTYGATAVSGNYLLSGNHVTGTAATISFVRGTLDTGAGLTHTWGIFNTNNTNARTLTFNSSNITILDATQNALQFGSSTSGWTSTNVGGTSTITLTGSAAGVVANALTFYNMVFTGNGSTLIQSFGTGTIFNNLTRTGNAVKTDVHRFTGTGITVNGIFNCTGNSAINRILLCMNVVGSTPITITAAAISVNNTDFQDITGAGAATWDMSAVSSGNCGGNSMKALGDAAFTTSATQTATGTSSFTWSTHGWTSRVPLPQDDVVINNSFSASQTITADMPRLGRSINFTGATGTPQFTNGSTIVSIYGSLTLVSGMTVAGTGDINFCGRSSYQLTSATRIFLAKLLFNAPNGTYTLQDDCVSNVTTTSSLLAGTLDMNDHNLTVGQWGQSGTITRVFYMGSGTLELTSGTALGGFTSGTTTNLTVYPETSTILISSTSANIKQFVGGNLTYNNLTITGRNVLITGSNTFTGTLANNTAGLAEGLYLTSGTTQTVNSFLTNGSAGNLAKLRSSTSGLYGGGITLNGTDMAYSAVDHADFKPAGNWSVMGVFRTTAAVAANTQNIFSSYSQNTNLAGLMIRVGDGVTAGKVQLLSAKNTGAVSGTDYQVVTTSVTTYNDGALHKVIGTYDGTKLHLYIDGTEFGTGVAWTNAAVFAATNYVRVGCRSSSGTNVNWVSGLLDEVAFWNGTALTAANVTTLQSSQLADSAALLASSTVYYKFDIGAETTDTDAGAHTLTAIGSPARTTPGILAKPTKHNTIDYSDIADTTFQGGTKWYASTHSVDSAGNTGMAFSAEVPDGKGFMGLVR